MMKERPNAPIASNRRLRRSSDWAVARGGASWSRGPNLTDSPGKNAFRDAVEEALKDPRVVASLQGVGAFVTTISGALVGDAYAMVTGATGLSAGWIAERADPRLKVEFADLFRRLRTTATADGEPTDRALRAQELVDGLVDSVVRVECAAERDPAEIAIPDELRLRLIEATAALTLLLTIPLSPRERFFLAALRDQVNVVAGCRTSTELRRLFTTGGP
jgi:hypothetical protein